MPSSHKTLGGKANSEKQMVSRVQKLRINVTLSHQALGALTALNYRKIEDVENRASLVGQKRKLGLAGSSTGYISKKQKLINKILRRKNGSSRN